MKNKGVLLIWLAVLTTVNLFVFSKLNNGLQIELNWLTLSQILSLVGTVLFSLSFLLSTRSKWLELAFGGLDKVYRVHHIIGGISFVMIMHHPLFLLVNVLPRTDLALKYFWFSNNLAYNFGLISLYLTLLLLLLTFVVNLPYELWRKTHQYMSISLVFALLHILNIGSDIERFVPLKLWIIFWLATGMISSVYIMFLYKYFGPKYTYLIEKLETLGDVINITLKPKNKQMPYYPGQFVFLSINKINKESHPFSISSSGSDNFIRLGIKVLGDYTLKLKQLSVGDEVVLYGPYGRFYEKLFDKKDLVWVAGGIGVTPFLGMIEMVKKISNQKVNFIYCTKTASELIYEKEILHSLEGSEKISYSSYCTNEKGRITAKSILEIAGGFENKKFMLCGPDAMIHSLTEQLVSIGIKKRNIIFEDFNFK